MKFFRQTLYTKMLFLALVLELILSLIVFGFFLMINVLNSKDELRIIDNLFQDATKYRFEFSKTKEIDKSDEFRKKMAIISIGGALRKARSINNGCAVLWQAAAMK